MKENYIEIANKKRSEWAAGDAKRDEGLVDRTDVRTIEDIVYTASDTEDEKAWHLMDIYYPTNMELLDDNHRNAGTYPVIVSVHGGGWFYGDKKLYRPYCMKLASYGYAVVNFNYRLSPEYQYPAGFMDVCRLMEFLRDNAGEYQLDTDNLFAVGDSAGAQLLSQYCVWATNADYHKLLDPTNEIKPLLPKKVGLNCGVYNMADMYGREDLVEMYLSDEMIQNIDAGDLSSDLCKSFMSVLDYINSNFPETFLMLSVNDPLKRHSMPMKATLEKNGVPIVFKQYGEGSPDDGHVFHVNMKSELGQLCNDEEIAFFKKESIHG